METVVGMTAIAVALLIGMELRFHRSQMDQLNTVGKVIEYKGFLFDEINQRGLQPLREFLVIQAFICLLHRPSGQERPVMLDIQHLICTEAGADFFLHKFCKTSGRNYNWQIW